MTPRALALISVVASLVSLAAWGWARTAEPPEPTPWPYACTGWPGDPDTTICYPYRGPLPTWPEPTR